MLGAKRFSHTTGNQVHFIAVRYSNKHICVTNLRHIQNFRTASISLNGQYIKGIFHYLTAFIFLFNNHNIIRTVCQKFGNTVTHLTGANNNNTHKITCLSI